MATTCVSGRTFLGDLHGVGHGLGVDLPAVVRRDAEVAAVAVVEVGLEELNPPAGDEGAPYAPDQLLGLSAEHDAGDDLDPPVSRPVQHDFPTADWIGRGPSEFARGARGFTRPLAGKVSKASASGADCRTLDRGQTWQSQATSKGDHIHGEEEGTRGLVLRGTDLRSRGPVSLLSGRRRYGDGAVWEAITEHLKKGVQSWRSSDQSFA